MKDIIFVSHKQKQCGVYQYGLNTSNIIKDSKKYNFIYAEVESNGEFVSILKKYPLLSMIIYNYYPSTMSWLSNGLIKEREKFVKQLIIRHETNVPQADGYIYIDPSYIENGNNFSVGRPLLTYTGEYPINTVTTIGSFGFGFGNKGFPEIVKKVNTEFDNAIIRFVIPFAYFGDSTGKSARSIANICKSIPVKPGIDLQVSHNFLDTPEILSFLASNDINLFFYDYSYGRGPSSVLDYALSVKRPIGLTKSYQFKHMFDLPIFVEDRSIKDILSAGISPLQEYYQKWSKENIIKDYERIVKNFLE